jgi:uncharacterized protein YbjT (DUF2867 family)
MGYLTTLAQEAAVAGVARFVRVSGIGADPESRSPYIRARGRGELVVQQVFPAVSIVRPGVMFGPDDAARRKARRPDKAVQDLPLPRPFPTSGEGNCAAVIALPAKAASAADSQHEQARSMPATG